MFVSGWAARQSSNLGDMQDETIENTDNNRDAVVGNQILLKLYVEFTLCLCICQIGA